ncbi:MAG TPA: DUF3995 domain-containing protein [Fulvivirga sp.]|nr:DUF3995 domain-containing protein [Fulvivirga sp.]
MIQTLGLIESTILLLLSVLHFYWALGGKWAFAAALPTNEEGKRMLNPKKKDSLIVGFGLLMFAVFYFIKTDLILFPLPQWIIQYFGWVIAVIFILRSVGDFKYIGFFKKIRTTPFGKNDSKYYSPLCLFIGMVAVLIQLL